MTEKYVISISMVAEFFKENIKQLNRGENGYTSGHVLNMNFDASVNSVVLNGKVKASMKRIIYSVEVSIDLADKYIVSATCTCPRGQTVCHHMATLCIHEHHNVSVTDQPCVWSTKKYDNETVKTIKELFPSKHSTYEPIQEITEVAIETFKKNLGPGNVVGFSWLLQPHSATNKMSFLPQIEDIIFSSDYIESSDRNLFMMEKCKLCSQQIACVVENTKGQTKNEQWLIARKNRLTASNFGSILSAIKRNRYPPSLSKKLIDGYDLSSARAIQWGKENEPTAIATLSSALADKEVSSTGLWLHECGFLGASPDGLVGDNGVVEVKCPYKYRNTSLQQALHNDKSYIIYKEGQAIINCEHVYYHQIQGQLHLTNRDVCYLVIWTPNECEVAFIKKDVEWGDNLSLLKDFYLEKFVPYISGMER